MENRYFFISGALHVGALAAVMLFFAPAVKKPVAYYSIDFLGESFQSAAIAESPAAPAAEKNAEPAAPPAPPKPDKTYGGKTEITKAPAKKKITLSAPSVLSDKPSSSSSSAAKQSAGALKTEFSDFPHPWYIEQAKNALFNQWEKNRPQGTRLTALVTFAITRSGAIKDVKISKSSGSKEFDYAALSSSTNSAPFPPLPKEFDKNELTVTVEFQDQIN